MSDYTSTDNRLLMQEYRYLRKRGRIELTLLHANDIDRVIAAVDECPEPVNADAFYVYEYTDGPQVNLGCEIHLNPFQAGFVSCWLEYMPNQ